MKHIRNQGMTTFKVEFILGDPRFNWLRDQGVLDRMEYDWKKSLIIFEDSDDATAYSLRFNEYPVLS